MHDIVISGAAPSSTAPARRRSRATSPSTGTRSSAGRRQGRSAQARGPGRGPAGHAGLGRHPHPLRRPGHLGSRAGALLLAWRHDHRCSAIAASASRRCGTEHHQALIETDGGGRGHPRHHPRPKASNGTGRASRNISTRWNACRAPSISAPRSPTIRCASMGWANAPSAASGDRRGHRGDGAAHGGSAEGRRLRLHHRRTDQHKTPAGDLVPGRYAEHEELIAIGNALGRAGARHLRHSDRFRG